VKGKNNIFIKVSKKIGIIGVMLKLINENKAQEEKIHTENIIEKLIQVSRKEGSKKNLLYFLNKNTRNKKTKAVDPIDER